MRQTFFFSWAIDSEDNFFGLWRTASVSHLCERGSRLSGPAHYSNRAKVVVAVDVNTLNNAFRSIDSAPRMNRNRLHSRIHSLNLTIRRAVAMRRAATTQPHWEQYTWRLYSPILITWTKCIEFECDLSQRINLRCRLDSLQLGWIENSDNIAFKCKRYFDPCHSSLPSTVRTWHTAHSNVFLSAARGMK